MIKDPVCGMEVFPESAVGRLEHRGVTYYFCSKHCQTTFQGDPSRYVAGATAQGGEASGT